MNEHGNPKQVHPPLGAYSHTVKVPPNATWLILSGQVGVNASGKLQTGMRRQAEQVFRNILACLRANRMRKENLVKLVVYTKSASVCRQFLDRHAPARAASSTASTGATGTKAPSAAQLSFAEAIARHRGIAIPDEVRASAAATSKWIDTNRRPKSADRCGAALSARPAPTARKRTS